MKLEEAIEGLRYLISDDCTDSQFDYVDEIETAIEALGKQIPKKPTESDDVIKSDYQCPNCKEYWDCDTEYGLKHLGYKYCPCCGQAILWE